MIDWRALALVATRTAWFMLAYFVGMMGLVVWQKAQHTEDMHPWAVPFSVGMIIIWVLVISGVVVI